ncbi:MAG TPA: serine dehydrogenasease [Rhizobiales bacterium]|nr:serine dehydrogenasease [Hyphomicrobiales bacterium]
MAKTRSGSKTPEDHLEKLLDDYLERLEDVVVGDAVVFVGPLIYGADEVIRDTLEAIRDKKAKLVVLLETDGGYIEVVERIVSTLRHYYQSVEFVVPSYAMSAGTVLAMSGDAIYMDYFSLLGPIDPQVQRPDGQMIPALGYLIQYERLIKKSREGKLTTAELTYLVQKFDPAELYRFEQARELSITLLKEWLVNYKFRNWTKTRSRKRPVTPSMRTRRAGQIAKELNRTEKWHSHSRGISMEVLARDLRLEVHDFGKNHELNEKIRAYYGLLKDYMARVQHGGVVHARGSYRPLGGI